MTDLSFLNLKSVLVKKKHRILNNGKLKVTFFDFVKPFCLMMMTLLKTEKIKN